MTDISDNTDPRILSWLEQARARLLDLTMRNRALNFRVNKVTTVAIVDEMPAEVFRRLVIDSKPMKFRPTSELPLLAAASEPDDPLDIALGLSDPTDDAADSTFEPIAAEALEPQHTDEWLQTRKRKEDLDTSLRRLEEASRLSLDEQGVNPLYLSLGMLRYREADSSTEIRRAPVVLIPVTLERKGARAAYAVRAIDDPLVNPSLIEYLKAFHVGLPRLPEGEALPDGYDLQELFAGVVKATGGQAGWSLTNDIYLGLFSFERLALYEDLGRNAPSFARHPIVRRLVTHEGAQHVGLPEEIRKLDLDAQCAPEVSHQVVDADASQARAIAAVARGHDLVIEGPPGTGKSQTITNLIAETLAAGKTVLFVAEKKAALDVVHSRLEKVGLGEFCLELHSAKASKRAVLASIGAALNLSLRATAQAAAAGAALPEVRRELTEYARAVHEPHGAIGLAPFRGYFEYETVRDAPRAVLTADVANVNKADYDRTLRELDDLSVSGVPIGDPSSHPFRDATMTFYSPEDVEDIGAMLEDVSAQLSTVMSEATAVARAFGLPEITSFESVAAARTSVDLVSRSPGAPRAVLGSEAWNAAPPEAAELIALGREVCRLRDLVCSRFADAVLEITHRDDIAYIEQKGKGALSFLAWFESRYRSVRQRWISYRRDGYAPTLSTQALDMRDVDSLRECRRKLEQSGAAATALFGDHWRGESSSWTELEAYVEWVVRFRAAIIEQSLAPEAIEVAATSGRDTRTFEQLRSNAVDLHANLGALEASVGWPHGYLGDRPFTEIDARVSEAREGLQKAQAWAAFERARQNAANGAGREIVSQALKGLLAMNELSRAFRRAFWSTWISGVVRARPRLEQFDSLTHEQRIREFKRLDSEVLVENRSRLIGRLRDRTHEMLQSAEAKAALPYLNHQIALQRRHAPIRQTIEKAGSVIRAIKPCLLMSPLTAAQLLADGSAHFDLVVFDEASQLPVEDAVGAICRGRQVAVVGDRKQLPPTNFFGVTLGTVAPVLDEQGQVVFTDSESILDEILGSGIASSPLLWHYRSTHESLIHFSNVSFYDGKLYTFPSTDAGARDGGVEFEYVEEGCYEKGGLNMPEVRRVAAAIVEFARKNLQKPESERQSLGVGTFNLRQSIAILDTLERERRINPDIEEFFSRDAPEPFFVKNLENIQGDERDVIFISVTFGKESDGRIRYNLGPINLENGWRRVNVLVTRARRHMRVFASMRAADMMIAGDSRPGAALLKSFLHYAETGVVAGGTAEVLADAESPFEREVLSELVRHGLDVHPQVGSGHYRIDIGVVDSEMPGRYLCGIECDGVAYHASETARDRDRLRQQVLEARGWTIHRIWSTDWFKNRPGQVERILGLIEATRNRAREASTKSDADTDPDRGPAPLLPTATTIVEQPSYTRPVGRPYVRTPNDYRYAGRSILEMPLQLLIDAVAYVARQESPIAKSDLIKSVVAAFATKAGSRIRARLEEAIREAIRQGRIVEERGFCREISVECELRNRAGAGLGPETVSPEEYRLAVTSILVQGRPFTREGLFTEVRGVFGYGAASAALKENVLEAVEELIAKGRIGEGATGLAWRER